VVFFHHYFADHPGTLVRWAITLAWSEVSYHLDEGPVGVYRCLEYAADSAPMIKIEAFVPSRMISRVITETERILPRWRMHR
jgi:hypothetical protein